ncbi:hypothetical protein V6259_11830 [Marinomonas sp. TI.3.20]|uniref:hypothetical protein n=1 Tax=Marinomonas sp. TI.3.20 TaxID=3121296 RepID=UPI00311DDA9B
MLLVENGKTLAEPYNASLGFWLPPDTSYGNLQLKYMKIIWRLDEANRRISDSWEFWEACSKGSMFPFGALERHVFSNEETIYMLRKAGDELVSMIWLLAKYEDDGQYPKKIKVDCLGAVVSQSEEDRLSVFSNHIELMQVLNDIANAFKHSFINSDHTLLGLAEPRIHALGLAYNKLSSKTVFYDISVDELVKKYNEFYESCVKWLSEYSEKHR